MSKFSQHFKMNEADIIEYVKYKKLFESEEELNCKEIGDGNINYVFRVVNPITQKSVIVKHSDILLRSSGRLLSTDRNRIEAEVLMLHNKLAPAYVPDIYLYDPVMCCIVMQDLSEYQNMRYALIEQQSFATFADDITTFIAQAIIRTTDNVIGPIDKKEYVKSFINPELCQISEKLVFTDPYTNYYKTNIPLEENFEFFEQELYKDTALCIEAAKLKENFKSNAQALIHGDLHTGSIFVKEGATMVLDPEFAFYGPVGYDVGNVIANLIFAWVRAYITAKDRVDEQQFFSWVQGTVVDVVDLFYQKSVKILEEEATEPMVQIQGYVQWYMANIMADTAGFTGTELIRRIIGDAKVKDIAGIEDINQRKVAERLCVLCAKEFILNRENKYQYGKDYVDTIYQVLAKEVSDETRDKREAAAHSKEML